jgi:hypothetical protein
MSVKEYPHYSISANALADWLETQPEEWWLVDGSPQFKDYVDPLPY